MVDTSAPSARKLRRAIRRRFDEKENRQIRLPAVLGNGNNEVSTGEGNRVWVRIDGSAPTTAICDGASAVNNQAVWVGRPPHDPKEMHVLGIRRLSKDEVRRHGVENHREQHEPFGPDTIRVSREQIQQLKIIPIRNPNRPELRVFINPALIDVAGVTTLFGTLNADKSVTPEVGDLSAYAITTPGKARWVRLDIDTSGELVVTAGTEVNLSAITLADIPARPVDFMQALGAIRLYYGQSEFKYHKTNNDIQDLRHVHAHIASDIPSHTHTESDITDLSHDAVKIDGITVDLTGIADGQTIIYDLANTKFIAGDAGASLTVEEIDGTPSVANVTKIKVPNGTLTDNGDGTLTLDFGSAATDGAAIHDNTAGEIAAIAEKTALVSGDMLIIEDSEDDNNKKMVKVDNLPGGGSVTPVYTKWDQDAPPSSAGACDDEFNDASFDTAKWTEFDPNSVLTITEADYGLTFDETTRAGDNIVGCYQTIPAGDFSIITKVSLSAIRSTVCFTGLALWENPADTSKGIYTLDFQKASNVNSIEVLRFNNHNNINSATIAINDILIGDTAYLRIRRTGTTYGFDWGLDGLGWERIYSGSLAFTPTKFGLILNNVNTGVTIRARFDFFRYKSSDVGFVGVLEGRAIGQGSA